MIEVLHREFFPKVEQTDFSIGEWTAVCFLLLYEDQKKLNLPIDEMEQLINLAKGVFTDFNEGFFVRFGWTVYLACIKNDKDSVVLDFDKSITELGQINKYCKLWIYNIVKIGGNPVKTIHELEWKTHKRIKL